MHTVRVRDIAIGEGHPLALIAGPCVIESGERTRRIAGELVPLCARLGLPLIFKASYDKANRTSLDSFRGPGLEAGLEVLAGIAAEFGCPVTTDVHEPGQCEPAAEVVDLLQIPAFLCRQTDLLVAAAASGRPVSVKKGQFTAPEDMRSVVAKLARAAGVLLVERGTTFGYHNLVVDFRSLPILRGLGWPVVFDGTHSVQRPSAGGTHSGGDRQYVAPLCRAAVAVGVDALFLEVHDQPEVALCDGPNMIALADLPALLESLLRIREALHARA